MTQTAAYYRNWRAGHPEYRARQRVLRADRRRRQGRESRAAEYARRASRAFEPLPTLHRGHALFDAARAVVGQPRSGLTILHDPLHEDLLSEAVVALLEGRDPAAAVRAYRSAESAWRRVIGPIFTELAA